MLTVAPFTGAWIETEPMLSPTPGYIVAPFTGAWIETTVNGGLYLSGCTVAPFTGAWIETGR